MKTEMPKMVEVVEIFSPLAGSMGRRKVYVQLPFEVIKREIGSIGVIEPPCNLCGKPALVVRGVPLGRVDELAHALRAEERLYWWCMNR